MCCSVHFLIQMFNFQESEKISEAPFAPELSYSPKPSPKNMFIYTTNMVYSLLFKGKHVLKGTFFSNEGRAKFVYRAPVIGRRSEWMVGCIKQRTLVRFPFKCTTHFNQIS